MTNQDSSSSRIEVAGVVAPMPVWKQTLLWIAVLPGSFLGALAAGFVFNLLFLSAAVAAVGSPHPEDQSWFLYVLRGVAVRVISGATFVWCGARIAPQRKNAAAIALAVLVFAMSSYGGFLLIAQHKWTTLTTVPSLIAGAIGAAKSVAKKTVTI